MKNHIKIGLCGLGDRGRGMALLARKLDGVELTAVCDPLPHRVEQFFGMIKDGDYKNDVFPTAYSSHTEMFEKEQLDGVLIHTSWHTHVLVATDAMKHGIYPAIDCGGACSVDECWQLVRTSEETGVRCMFLENCCYDRNEMTLLRMIKMGMFGELIHCQGGYEHDLREEIAFGRENEHYRFYNYLNRNAELYPQHALGPIMKYLNINHGNRIVSLTSTASKARGLHEFIMEQKGPDYDASSFKFTQGDIVTTVLKCAHGETILLTHDTTLPRPYSRGGRVQGTKGLWMEDNASAAFGHEWEPFSKFTDNPEYEHPLWTWARLDPDLENKGHGGMDFLVLEAYFTSIRLEEDPPIDVYDAAVLLSISALSEQSIAKGSAPVYVPDFTDGKWFRPRKSPESPYALDGVYPERYEKFGMTV